ncbi:MAG: hypothetical protein Q9221_001036 [Calogaya cf. arnoldii]
MLCARTTGKTGLDRTLYTTSKGRQNLAFARASKQLYGEILAQFFHKRSLAVIFTTAESYPLEHRRDSGQRWTSMRGTMVNSVKLAQRFSATNFANFDSIKLLIELPHPICVCVGDSIDRLVGYIKAFSLCVQDWQERLGPYATRLSIDVVVYTRSFEFEEDTADEEDDLDSIIFEGILDSQQLYPSLKTIALLLQPLRDIQKAKAVTVEADLELHFGQEWLQELFEQVAEDMMKAGKTMPGHWRWRQKNMEVALDQSDSLTRDVAELGIVAAGGALPVGPPEEPPDDGIE